MESASQTSAHALQASEFKLLSRENLLPHQREKCFRQPEAAREKSTTLTFTHPTKLLPSFARHRPVRWNYETRQASKQKRCKLLAAQRCVLLVIFIFLVRHRQRFKVVFSPGPERESEKGKGKASKKQEKQESCSSRREV
eukprot:g54237.t1